MSSAGLGDDRGGGQRADAGDRGQQVPGGAKGRHHRLDLRVQLRDHRLQVIDVVQVQPAHQRVVLAEAALQRHRQVRDLRPHPADRQLRQHLRAALPVNERLDHRPPGLGDDGGGHRVDLDARVLEHVAEPLDLRGPRLDDLGAVADDIPGGLDVRRGDEAAREQPALQELHQPLRVGHVGLAPRDVLDVPGVAHQHLLKVPVLDQGVVDRHGIDPRRLHRHMGHALRDQPAGRLPQHPVERLELALDRLPGPPARHRAAGPPPRSRPCPHRPPRTARTAPA